MQGETGQQQRCLDWRCTGEYTQSSMHCQLLSAWPVASTLVKAIVANLEATARWLSPGGDCSRH